MKIELWKCDNCGKEYKPEHGCSIRLCVDREPDAAGGSTDVYDGVDLCCACLAVMIHQAAKGFRNEDRAKLINQFKRKMPR